MQTGEHLINFSVTVYFYKNFSKNSAIAAKNSAIAAMIIRHGTKTDLPTIV
jgi:hypothetical protein